MPGAGFDERLARHQGHSDQVCSGQAQIGVEKRRTADWPYRRFGRARGFSVQCERVWWHHSLKKFLVKGADGTVTFSFKVNQTSGAEPTPQLILAVVTDEAVTKLDAIPSGVTARALVPFMLNEIKRARQDPAVALLFFRLES